MVRRARARMIAPTISVSDRVNRIPLKAALIYTWMIPHADDQGRMNGTPEIVKAIVVPLRTDITVDDVKHAIGTLQTYGLIDWYDDNGKGDIIQLLNWWDFQALRNPAPSKYPPPIGWTDRVGTQKRDDFGRFVNT